MGPVRYLDAARLTVQFAEGSHHALGVGGTCRLVDYDERLALLDVGEQSSPSLRPLK
nr:hypothetical protein [Sinorhizobium medicae]